MSLHYLELIAVGILFLHYILISTKYGNIPDRIPTHFGIDGSPDSWGSKVMIWVLPILAAAMLLLMIYVNRTNHINIPEGIDASKAITMLKHLTISIQIIFILLSYISIKVARGNRTGLGKNFLVLFAALMIYPFLFLI